MTMLAEEEKADKSFNSGPFWVEKDAADINGKNRDIGT